MTFEEWWEEFSKNFSLDDADSLKADFQRCWLVAMEAQNPRYNEKWHE